MKKLWDSPVSFLAYGVPYAYLGFWGHGETGGALANFLSIIGVITLMKWAYHKNSLKALFLGNALSLLVSCACLSVFGTEKWGPLNPRRLFRCCARQRCSHWPFSWSGGASSGGHKSGPEIKSIKMQNISDKRSQP